MSGLRLGVNIDHVATLRQARYATMPESKNAEPDPLVTARVCERAGASGIVAHLRADRRHIQDRDIERLRANIMTKLNLEMGNTEEIIDVALRIVPDEVCLVPEKRRGSYNRRRSRCCGTAKRARNHDKTASDLLASVSACLLIRLWNRWTSPPSSACKWSSCIPGNWRMRSRKNLKKRNWKSCAQRREPHQNPTSRSTQATALITKISS